MVVGTIYIKVEIICDFQGAEKSATVKMVMGLIQGVRKSWIDTSYSMDRVSQGLYLELVGGGAIC